MTNISKHNSEQKRESDHVECSRVYFLIIWSSIGYDYFMEGPLKLIKIKMSWWSKIMLFDFIKLYNPTSIKVDYGLLYFCNMFGRYPRQSYEQ